jgi:hypothetical protein
MREHVVAAGGGSQLETFEDRPPGAVEVAEGTCHRHLCVSSLLGGATRPPW